MIKIKNFIVKICGVKDYLTAQNIFDLKPSMIGLVFVPGSIRCVELEIARKITTSAHKLRILVAGIFQNQETEYVSLIRKSILIDYVQLHGDEDVSYCRQINAPVIKTIKPDKYTINENKTIMNKYSGSVYYFLIDRTVQGMGETVDFKTVRELTKTYPVIVAGGLNVLNVESAITEAGKGLMGVDTSSGVESAPGEKDINLVQSFISNARRAYESI